MAAVAQLSALGEVTALLRARGIPHWLFGGWAVDFTAGRISREHGDVDLVVQAGDHERARTLLRGTGWIERPYEHPEEGSRHERDGVRLELTLVEQDGDGRWITPGRWVEYPWPDGAFGSTTRTLGDVTCPVVGLDALVALKQQFFDVGDRGADDREARDRALLESLRS